MPYQTNKKAELVNPVEAYINAGEEPEKGTPPALKLYIESKVWDKETKEKKDGLVEVVALWANKSKLGKTFYTGKLGNARVVGFYNE